MLASASGELGCGRVGFDHRVLAADASRLDASPSDAQTVGAGADGGALDATPGADGEIARECPPVTSVAVGTEHVCFVTTSAELYCAGSNALGQLGVVGPASTAAPLRVEGAYLLVSAGRLHTCAVDAAGAAFCWGGNNAGQLGAGDTASRSTPARVGALAPSLVDASLHQFTCAVTGGVAACWGENALGQLGLGDTTQRRSPAELTAVSAWSDVSLGVSHACGVSSARIYCWGSDLNGRLGLGTTDVDRTVPTQIPDAGPWAHVIAGGRHTCAIRTEGSLWCWGDSTAGRLGVGPITGDQPAPLRVGAETDWVSGSGGGHHVCGIRADETLWCWGRNDGGQLGTGDLLSRDVPVQVIGPLGTERFARVVAGVDATCAITTEGQLLCTGNNGMGQLGASDAIVTRLTPRCVTPAL